MARCTLSTKNENQPKEGGKRDFHEKHVLNQKENQIVTKPREALQNIQNKNVLQPNELPQKDKNKMKNKEKEVRFGTIYVDINTAESVSVPKLRQLHIDFTDPFQYGEYIEQVYMYLRTRERKATMSEDFVSRQGEITDKMRWILVDWIVQVHSRFSLTQETLFISIQLLDRYIEKSLNIKRNQLQLVGITCLLLASKYEEQCVPEMKDYVYVTDYSCTGAQIRELEVIILNTLDFDLSPPIPLHFLRRITKACLVGQTSHNLAKYFMELCLLDSWICKFAPSFIAAACLCLALKVIGEDLWNEKSELISGYEKKDLYVLMHRLPYLLSRNEDLRLTALYSKFKQKAYSHVSQVDFLKSDEFQNFYLF